MSKTLTKRQKFLAGSEVMLGSATKALAQRTVVLAKATALVGVAYLSVRSLNTVGRLETDLDKILQKPHR